MNLLLEGTTQFEVVFFLFVKVQAKTMILVCFLWAHSDRISSFVKTLLKTSNEMRVGFMCVSLSAHRIEEVPTSSFSYFCGFCPSDFVQYDNENLSNSWRILLALEFGLFVPQIVAIGAENE